jgi:4-hydroxy 2-oxovalerate aldolase
VRNVLISDASLRDGNHAVSHQLGVEQVAGYCRAADAAGVPIIEVGHGNGLGASSLQLGESAIPDEVMLATARENLRDAKLSVHVIPGFATIKKDLERAVEIGVDVVRVASHCSEADLTERHIAFAREAGCTVYGVLMMSHMISVDDLVDQASKMASYGAEGVVFMDSSGHFLPADIRERVLALLDGVRLPVGFHAHNNLGMAIANSVAALEAGASMLDGCSRGFGAGSGNAQLEVLVAVLERMGYRTGIDLYKVLDAADYAEANLMKVVPTVSSNSVISGLTGVFSGFIKPVLRMSERYGVDARAIFVELGRRKVIAGQEDLIIEVAEELARKQHRRGA